MKRLNAFGEETNIPAMKLRPNIKGQITSRNKNYTKDHLHHLDPIFPQEDPEVAMIKHNRNPETDVPDRLPTNGLPFYPIDEHKAIGEFETKQNLYLVLAHAYNRAIQRIEELERQVKEIKK